MSIISHLLVVVLLSFLFCHGPSARCFGLINNQLPKRLHLLSKQTMTEEKLKHYRASTPSLPEEELSIKISDKKHEETARKEAHHHHHEKKKKKKMGNKNGEKDGAVSSSVTWKVREKKRGEPQAEFNLDYLPARTHPPVHN